LVGGGCIKPLCDLLTVSDTRIITMVLNALENILKVWEADAQQIAGGCNHYANEIEEAGGLDKIEKLQVHQDIEIYQRAAKILKIYFEAEEVQNVASNNVNNNDLYQQTGTFADTPKAGFDS
jgi:importin subunit alpha-1